jgi:hypothetical protein
VHGQLITQARDEALRIMKDNPKLKGERGEALRCLLYLYRAGRGDAADRRGVDAPSASLRSAGEAIHVAKEDSKNGLLPLRSQ